MEVKENIEQKNNDPADVLGDEDKDSDKAKWYTQTIQQTELADYSPVKGCMVIRPNGYGIWERMQRDQGTSNADIAAELGYASASAFTAMVRRTLGAPPTQFFA